MLNEKRCKALDADTQRTVDYVRSVYFEGCQGEGGRVNWNGMDGQLGEIWTDSVLLTAPDRARAVLDGILDPVPEHIRKDRKPHKGKVFSLLKALDRKDVQPTSPILHEPREGERQQKNLLEGLLDKAFTRIDNGIPDRMETERVDDVGDWMVPRAIEHSPKQRRFPEGINPMARW